MVTIDNPLSWPLFPVLPVVRVGSDPFEPGGQGLLFSGPDLRPILTVFVANICDQCGRPIGAVMTDGAIVREVYASLADLGRHWMPD